ncbi:MAG TPA: hypothetical protein PLC53_01475 [Bacilli bacterium]|nr:hypothetical protein [Bacilli bacterium]
MTIEESKRDLNFIKALEIFRLFLNDTKFKDISLFENKASLMAALCSSLGINSDAVPRNLIMQHVAKDNLFGAGVFCDDRVTFRVWDSNFNKVKLSMLFDPNNNLNSVDIKYITEDQELFIVKALLKEDSNNIDSISYKQYSIEYPLLNNPSIDLCNIKRKDISANIAETLELVPKDGGVIESSVLGKLSFAMAINPYILKEKAKESKMLKGSKKKG